MSRSSAIAALVLGVSFGNASRAATNENPVIDNRRVTVRDITMVKGNPSPAQRHDLDSVEIYLTPGVIKTTRSDGKSSTTTHKKGDAKFEPKGTMFAEEVTSDAPVRAIVIDLKDTPVPPLPNTSGYPNAFPRPGVKKLFENDRVIVWDYTWMPGVPTPMHFHDKDVVVVYLEDGDLKSTTLDGKSVVNQYSFGLAKYNDRNRTHTEDLIKGKQRAIITEFKYTPLAFDEPNKYNALVPLAREPMRRTAMKRASCWIASVLLCSVVPVTAQSGAKNGEWPTYGGDLGNTRYSALDQVTSANFDKLQIAWRFKTDNLGPTIENNLEGTPLMVKGVLYATAGTRRAVIALDAATGELLWTHSENEGERGNVAPRKLSGRGLAYWTDGREERILYVTPGYRLVALNAKNGMAVSTFGKNGIVDLKEDDDQVIDLMSSEIGLHSAPIVAKDTVIVGAAHKPGGVPTSKTNVKGYVRGFDVRTGKRLWTFHTIPKPGEQGLETWLNDSWSYTGNTGSWGQMSVDEDLGLVYIGVELPTGDYYGGHRPGNNLFGESLVAADLKTGKVKWYYQYVHHGIWDMDNPCPPILTNITVNGQTVKAVAQPTKQAFLYVLNRETGVPIWPIVERPVAKGDVPGEWYSPTQPFPTKPPAYDRQGIAISDLIDFSPALRAEAEQLVSRYKIGPMFTPGSLSKPEGPIATLTLATAGGGSNWPGGSYDPETHIVYVSSQAGVTQIGLIPGNKERTDVDFQSGTAQPAGARGGAAGRGAGRGAAGANIVSAPATAAQGEGDAAVVPPPAAAPGGGGLTVRGLPLIKPPYGQISAIDLNKGEILWQVAHGETPDNIRNHPDLKGANIPRTGRTGTAGTLVTKTLVIAGEKGTATMPNGMRGAYLRAYDKATGKDAGALYMPAPQTGSPMTYSVNGKQYIVVAIASGEYSAEYRAYRLPN